MGQSPTKAILTSVASKFVSSGLVFDDTGFNKHLSHPSDHGGRTGDIVYRPSQIIQILGQHISVDPPGLALSPSAAIYVAREDVTQSVCARRLLQIERLPGRAKIVV